MGIIRFYRKLCEFGNIQQQKQGGESIVNDDKNNGVHKLVDHKFVNPPVFVNTIPKSKRIIHTDYTTTENMATSQSPFRPVSPIKLAVADCLRDMPRLHLSGIVEVGNSSSHLQYATVGSRRKA